MSDLKHYKYSGYCGLYRSIGRPFDVEGLEVYESTIALLQEMITTMSENIVCLRAVKF